MAKKKKKNRPEPESLGLPRVGVESHAHLDLEDFDEDREAILARARDCGIARIGNVFLGPDAYEKNRHLFADHPEVFFLLGVHPNDSGTYQPEQLVRMREHFRAEPRLKAVGEIGLDYYWERVPNHIQQRVFAEQLELARELGLPPVIHSRDAHEDAVAVLREGGFVGQPVLWHCYGSGPDFARELLDYGWTISIPGPVTYRKNDELCEAAKLIPLDRMVIESDCPFLSPEPWRGKRNHPALTGFTAAFIASLKGLSPEAVWKATGETAERFFGL